jgi:outer membrane protein assembly factor BamB
VEQAASIVRFDAAGQKAWEAIFHPTLREEPWSLRGDGAGGALLSGFDEDGSFLVRYAPDGTQVWAVRSAGRSLARGIGLDAAGQAYFGGTLDGGGVARVLRVSPSGAVSATFEYAGAAGERLEGGALAVTPAGEVRLALGRRTLVQLPEDPPGLLGSLQSYRIVGFAADGALAFEQDLPGTAETTGIDGFGTPTHAALDGAGNLLVTGSLRRYSAYVVPLHKLAPDGTLVWTRTLLPLASNVPRAADLEVDAGGGAVVAAEGAFVARVEADGRVAWIREPLGGVGAPAVALAPDGAAVAAVTLPPSRRLNRVELVRLEAGTQAPAGDLVAKRKLAFKKVFSNHATRTTRIKNGSRTACLAVELGTSGPPFVAGGTLVLPPRGKASVWIALAPETGDGGPFEGTLQLRSSDPEEPLRELRLQGRR